MARSDTGLEEMAIYGKPNSAMDIKPAKKKKNISSYFNRRMAGKGQRQVDQVKRNLECSDQFCSKGTSVYCIVEQPVRCCSKYFFPNNAASEIILCANFYAMVVYEPNYQFNLIKEL